MNVCSRWMYYLFAADDHFSPSICYITLFFVYLLLLLLFTAFNAEYKAIVCFSAASTAVSFFRSSFSFCSSFDCASYETSWIWIKYHNEWFNSEGVLHRCGRLSAVSVVVVVIVCICCSRNGWSGYCVQMNDVTTGWSLWPDRMCCCFRGTLMYSSSRAPEKRAQVETIWWHYYAPFVRETFPLSAGKLWIIAIPWNCLWGVWSLIVIASICKPIRTYHTQEQNFQMHLIWHHLRSPWIINDTSLINRIDFWLASTQRNTSMWHGIWMSASL